MPQKPSFQVIGNKPSALIICGDCGTAHVFRLELTIQFMTLTCNCGNLISWARSGRSISDAAAIAKRASDGE